MNESKNKKVEDKLKSDYPLCDAELLLLHLLRTEPISRAIERLTSHLALYKEACNYPTGQQYGVYSILPQRDRKNYPQL